MFSRTKAKNQDSGAPQPAGELQLTVVDADWSCRVHGSLVIGSDAACDLRLSGGDVGSRHAEIYSVDGRWWLRDLGSSVGTFVHGDMVEAEPLQLPAEVSLGPEGPVLRLG